MKRKVNRVGTSTLTVSLPTAWVKKYNVKQGDEVEVNTTTEGLLISKHPTKHTDREYVLDIQGMGLYELSRWMAVLYRIGYDRIILKYDSFHIRYEKQNKDLQLIESIKKLVDRNLGMEIVAQSSTRTEIVCFVSDEARSLPSIEKRIFYLIHETFNQLFEATKGDFKQFHDTVYTHHDTITKFINYYLRELEASDLSFSVKQFSYSLYMFIDKLVDKIRHISEKIQAHGCSKKVLAYLREIADFLHDQFVAWHELNFPKELVERRFVLVNKVAKEKFSYEEFQVMSEAKYFLDSSTYFSELIIARKLTHVEHS